MLASVPVKFIGEGVALKSKFHAEDLFHCIGTFPLGKFLYPPALIENCLNDKLLWVLHVYFNQTVHCSPGLIKRIFLKYIGIRSEYSGV